MAPRVGAQTCSLGLWVGVMELRAFHGFGQTKFANGGFDFRLKQIYTTAPAAFKNDAQFKSGQNQLKI